MSTRYNPSMPADRILDSIQEITHKGKQKSVHVRIWKHSHGQCRIVLISPLGRPVPIHEHAELVASIADKLPNTATKEETYWFSSCRLEHTTRIHEDEIHFKLYPKFQRRRNPWFPRRKISTPDPLTVVDMHYHLSSKNEIEETIGEVIEHFPAGTYTREVVQRYIGGERPVNYSSDPWNLENTIQYTICIANQVEEFQPQDESTCPIGSLRHKEALSAALTLLAGKIELVSLLYNSDAREFSNSTVQLKFPSIPDRIKADILIPALSRPSQFLGASELGRYYMELFQQNQNGDTSIRNALDEAVREITYHYRLRLLHIARESRFLPRRLDLTDSQSREYFQTVSWMDESDIVRVDPEVKAELLGIFWREERKTNVRYFRDPQLRLGLYNPIAEALAVSCPAYTNFPEWDSQYTYLSLNQPENQYAELIRYDDRVELRPVMIDAYNS